MIFNAFNNNLMPKILINHPKLFVSVRRGKRLGGTATEKTTTLPPTHSGAVSLSNCSSEANCGYTLFEHPPDKKNLPTATAEGRFILRGFSGYWAKCCSQMIHLQYFSLYFSKSDSLSSSLNTSSLLL